MSPCYGGSISDRRLVEVSGLLEKLEPGDEVMADKGFQIQDILAPLGVRLNTPPFLAANTQLSADDVMLTSKNCMIEDPRRKSYRTSKRIPYITRCSTCCYMGHHQSDCLCIFSELVP